MVLKSNLCEMLTQEDNLTRDRMYNWEYSARYTGYTNYYPHQKPSVNISLLKVGQRYVLFQ